MFYLASPYSLPEVVVREQRFRADCGATARLISTDHIVFSRIIHGHPLVLDGLPTFYRSGSNWCDFDSDAFPEAGKRQAEAVVIFPFELHRIGLIDG